MGKSEGEKRELGIGDVAGEIFSVPRQRDLCFVRPWAKVKSESEWILYKKMSGCCVWCVYRCTKVYCVGNQGNGQGKCKCKVCKPGKVRMGGRGG
jgi:hypothetical protein